MNESNCGDIAREKVNLDTGARVKKVSPRRK